jgi:hypothetical protein
MTTRAEADHAAEEAEWHRIACHNTVAVLVGETEKVAQALVNAARNAGFRDPDLWQASLQRPLRYNDWPDGYTPDGYKPDLPVPTPPDPERIAEARARLREATAEVAVLRAAASLIKPTDTKPGPRDRIAGRSMLLSGVRYSKGDIVSADALDVLPHHRLAQLETMGFVR